jgi:hypothetical protein
LFKQRENKMTVKNIPAITDEQKKQIIEQGKDESLHLFGAKNEIWKLRTDTGRKKLFQANEQGELELITKVQEYFSTKRYYTKKEMVKGGPKSGKIVKYKIDAPYTIEGLCTHLGIDARTFRNYRNDPNYSDFFPLFAYIDNIIKTQQYEAALLGMYDARFVALLNGIKEQHDITSNDQSIFSAIQFNVINNNSKEKVNDIQQALNSPDD